MKIGNSKLIKDTERYIKRCIKGRYKFSKALVITFLICGVFSGVGYGADVWLHYKDIETKDGDGLISIVKKSQVMYDGKKPGDIPDEATILSDYGNKTGAKASFSNQDFNKTVIIGSRSVAGGHGGTAIGFGAIVGENTKTNDLSAVTKEFAENKLKDNKFIRENPEYGDYKKKYEDTLKGNWGQINITKKLLRNKIIKEFEEKLKQDIVKKSKEILNQEGTAVGYRTFSRGNEATALGNDVVAWGNSSIAIGSDNASEDEKALSKDMFRLYYNARADFNTTASYAAVKFEKEMDTYKEENGEEKKVKLTANSDSILLGDDGETISTQDGSIYVRKNEKNWDEGWYVYKNGEFYETSNGDPKLHAVSKEKENEIKQLKDWKKYEEHIKVIDTNYKEYLKDPERFKSHTWARGNNAIAIGARSVAFGKNSTALGTFAFAGRNYATAIGSNTAAFGKKALAVGNEAYVYSNESVGVGNNVQAINDGSMVYGANSYSGGRGSLAIGDHTFANITMSDEFNNKGFTKNEPTDENKKTKFIPTVENNIYNSDFSLETLYEEGNTADIQNLGIRYFAASTTEQSGTGEFKAKQSKDKDGKHNQGAIAIGSYSVALGDNAITLGRYAYAREDNTVAIGRFAFAKENSSFALGSFSRAIGKNAFAIGISSHAKSNDSMAIGNNAEANFENSIALGFKSKTDYTEEELKADAWAPKYAVSLPNSKKIGYLSVGGKDAERRIVNLAPGASDTDAVNVSQLRALEESILYGNPLDENESNLGTHYISIKGKEEYFKLLTKVQDYKNYTKLKRDYLKLKARKGLGGEDIDLSRLEERLKKYDEKYNDFSEKSLSLQVEYEKNGEYNLTKINSDTDEEFAKKRKQYLEKKFKEIDTAYEKDTSEDKIESLIPNNKKEALKKSNFDNKGAETYESVAIGHNVRVEAGNKQGNSVAIGSNVTVKGKENQIIGNNITLGNNTNWSIIIGNNIKTPDNEKIVEAIVLGDRSEVVGKALSIGGYNENNKTYRSRPIKFVKAGNLGDESTDAVNASQLKPVYDVLGLTQTGIQPDIEKANLTKQEAKGGYANVTKPTFDLSSGATQHNGNTVKEALKYLDDTIKASKPHAFYTKTNNNGNGNTTITNDSTSYQRVGDKINNIVFSKEFKVEEKPEQGQNGEKYLLVTLNKEEISKMKELRGPKGGKGDQGLPGNAGGSSTGNSGTGVTKDEINQIINEKLNGYIKDIKDDKKNIKVSKKGTVATVVLKEKLTGISSVNKDKNSSMVFNQKNDKKNSIPNTTKYNVTINSNGGKFEFNRKGLHINNRKITGLADISDSEKDESIAVNKKYVDDQLAKVNSDSLIENIYHDDEGNEVVKHTDGKYYKKDDTEKNNGKDESKVKEIVKIKGSDKQITNVSSGLGLSDENQENKEKLEKAQKELTAENEKLKAVQEKISKSEENEAKIKEELEKAEKELEKDSKNKELQEKVEEIKDKLKHVEAAPLKEQKSKIEETIKQKQEEISKLEESLDSEKVKQLVNDKLKDKEKNVATIRDLKEVAKSGINFKGNDDKELNVKISDTLSIKGEGDTKDFTSATGNIRVESSDNTMTIKLSDSLKNMTSFETKDYANGNGSKIDASGLTVKGDGSEAVYGKDSIVFKKGNAEIIKIDGSKGELSIPDITDKSSDNAAVNKKYVDTIRTNVDEQVSGLKGGVAGAMAMANLVQANSNSEFRHQLSAAFGAYDGKQALALGYSGVSQNRRLVYKLSGSVDSAGKLGFGAGIGIMLGEKQEASSNILREVENLKKENQELKNKNKEDAKRLEKNEADVKRLEKELQEMKELLKKMSK